MEDLEHHAWAVYDGVFIPGDPPILTGHHDWSCIITGMTLCLIFYGKTMGEHCPPCTAVSFNAKWATRFMTDGSDTATKDLNWLLMATWRWVGKVSKTPICSPSQIFLSIGSSWMKTQRRKDGTSSSGSWPMSALSSMWERQLMGGPRGLMGCGSLPRSPSWLMLSLMGPRQSWWRQKSSSARMNCCRRSHARRMKASLQR